jgi:outer membrane lipoprotein
MIPMKRFYIIVMISTGMLLACSSVMPRRISEQAVSLTFQELVDQGNAGIGSTVIVGGYVLSVENLKDHSRLEAIQAPLNYERKPGSRDLSRGRLIIDYPGFLDPEIYSRDRKITAGGTIVGSSTTEQNDKSYPYLHVQTENIHLWSVEPPPCRPDPWCDDCWGPFFPWYRFPPFGHRPPRRE